ENMASLRDRVRENMEKANKYQKEEYDSSEEQKAHSRRKSLRSSANIRHQRRARQEISHAGTLQFVCLIDSSFRQSNGSVPAQLMAVLKEVDMMLELGVIEHHK
ncbi:hypothetical protein P4O66_010137, partial [Electrophorus voltai]